MIIRAACLFLSADLLLTHPQLSMTYWIICLQYYPTGRKTDFIYFFTQYCSVYLPWCEVWSISHWVYEYMASLAWYSVLSFSSYANSSKDGNISLLVCLSGGPPLSSRNISTTVGWIAVKCCIVSHHAQKMNPYVFADPLNFHLAPLSGQFLNFCTALDSD